MPFVTEYNTSLILKRLFGEIPDDIRSWKPYKKDIYFLNRLDKTNLRYFKEFCENPIENIDGIYQSIEVVDTKNFVYEGAKPSYHKYQSCEKLNSNFINFKIPQEIKDKGDGEIEKYRNWFKENQEIFLRKPDVFEMLLHAKYGIVTKVQTVEKKNSGNKYKENLTLKDVDLRIGSLLSNASKYYKDNKQWQGLIRRYQTATFLAFRQEEISDNQTGFSDQELKEVLKEYYYLFVEPTIFYLKEYFKIYYNREFEINEKIFEQLNFKKCQHCYAEDYNRNSTHIDSTTSLLRERFGDYQFPIEPTKFHFKEDAHNTFRTAFFYARVFRLTDDQIKRDNFGEYKVYKIEFINHQNRFVYAESKVYLMDVPAIELFKYYLTRVEQNLATNEFKLTTYAVEL